MAQIIKHRRGSLEALSNVTGSLQKGEIVIASGSSNLTASNGNAISFIVPQDGQVQATNRIIRGADAPNVFPGSAYGGMLNGVPFYASSSTQLPTLFLLGQDGNEAINLVGNIQPFSASVATSINALSSSIGSGTIGNSVNSLNTFSGSAITRLGALEATGSDHESRISTAESDIVSINSELDNIDSAQIAQDSRLSNIEAFSGSQLTKDSALATITGSLISSASAAKSTNDSQDISITNLNAVSASLRVSVAALNTFSASTDSAIQSINSAQDTQDGRLDNLETFQSDVETAITLDGQNVTINGNFTVSGTQTIVDSTTVQIGDNIIELNGSGAANGGLYVKDVTAPNTNTGSIVWDSTNDYWKAGAKGAESKVLVAGGDSVVSGSSQVELKSTTGFTAFDSALAAITGSLISSASAAKTTNDAQGGRLNNLESKSASVDISVAALNSFTASNSLTNAFTASANSKFTEIGVVSGSLIASASAASVSIANLNSFSSSQLSKDSELATYTASVETRLSEIGVVSGSLISSASAAAVANANLNSFSASVLTRLTEIGVVSGSLIASASAAKSKNDAQDGRLDSLEATSASLNISVSNLNSFTSSANSKFTEIGVVSGSLISSASNAASRLTTLEGSGDIQGLGTSNEVNFAKVTTSGDVVIGGDLVVQGNTVTLNTATLVVEDKLITLASGSTSNATADGAGFEVAGTSASFKYDGVANQFSSSVAVAANVTGSINIPGAGSSKRLAFRNVNGNIDFVAAPSTVGDIAQWNGSDFVMSNTIDGGSF